MHYRSGRCPKCKKTIRTLEDEWPEEHGCSRCGYGVDPRDYEIEEEEGGEEDE